MATMPRLPKRKNQLELSRNSKEAKRVLDVDSEDDSATEEELTVTEITENEADNAIRRLQVTTQSARSFRYLGSSDRTKMRHIGKEEGCGWIENAGE